ncbi:MAG: prepilin-type cleavage/methylation domain-containing protein, partial [Verrucomicrobiota bacterium]
QKAQGIMCLSNTKQLTLGWTMYAHDNKERLIYNKPSADNGNWVANKLNWLNDPQNINVNLIKNALLASYVANNLGVYKCPADVVPSLAGPRTRSVSMNAFVGDIGGGGSINPAWQQFLKLGDFRNPSGIYVFLDEHPDSINDGWFVFCTAGDPAERTQWSDLPASYHNGACGFSFADGHSEIKRWLVSTTKRPVMKSETGLPAAVGSNTKDITWVAERTTVKK